MRKIPADIENPIDNILLIIIEKVHPYFHKLGFTPNILTTFSLLFWLGGLYFFVKNGKYYEYYTVGLLFISYFFDCFDGHFARTYNMTTKFGDYYDHISDVLKKLLLLYFIITIYGIKSLFLLLILSIFMILFCVHLSCQELWSGSTSDTLSLLNFLCIANKKNVKNIMHITKYVGCGTFHLVLFLGIIYLKQM
jgi:hypothetical protein